MQSFENTEQIWELILQSLKDGGTSETVMELWFSKLRLAHLDDKSAILVTPSNLYREIIAGKFSETLSKHFELVLGYKIELNILSSQASDQSKEKSESVFDPDPAKSKLDTVEVASEILASSLEDSDSQYNGKNGEIGTEYTFDNFIVGGSNRFAHAACVAVADDLSGQYNPLFIHGQSGLGKTHLMYAITNEIRAKQPETKIIYIKGEEFTNELIEAIKANTNTAFKDKYRKADVLLIDDIQFIAGKDSTQEEFFHTFNTLYEDHRQIILTSDRPPKEIKTLEDRIRSRFEWGLIADIQPPDFELRLAILKNKAESMNLSVPNDVLNFLAEKLHSNIRQIEGAIKTLGAMSFLTGSPINIDLVKSSLPEFIKENEPIETTVGRITSIIAKKYGVSTSDIMSSKRQKDIAFARHMVIYVTRDVTELSLPALGKLFSRDHTTILSSCKVIEKELVVNQKIKNDINDIIREIKG